MKKGTVAEFKENKKRTEKRDAQQKNGRRKSYEKNGLNNFLGPRKKFLYRIK